MGRLHSILRELALLTVPVVGAFLIWTLWPLRAVLKTSSADESVLTVKVSGVLDQTSDTLSSINRLCETRDAKGNLLPCGVLADLNQTLGTIRGTAGQVEVAARHENANLTTLDTQERTLFSDAHQTLTSGAGTAQAATQTLQAVTTALQTAQPSIAATKPLLDAGTLAVGHVDTTTLRINAFLDSPMLKETGKHVEGATAHVDAITGDAQKVADRYANPPKAKWYQKTWNVAKFAAETLYDFIR